MRDDDVATLCGFDSERIWAFRIHRSLPAFLRDETLTLDSFKRCLKCFLFATSWHSARSALEIFNDSMLYKCSLNNNNNSNNCIDRMLILNVANSSVASSTQWCIPSINMQHSTYWKLVFKVWTYCTWCPLSDGTPTNIRIYLIFLETRIIGLHFAADSMDLSSFNFFLVGSVIFFLCKSDVSAVQSHPRSLIDFGTYRKGVCNFLLVHHSNLAGTYV